MRPSLRVSTLVCLVSTVVMVGCGSDDSDASSNGSAGGTGGSGPSGAGGSGTQATATSNDSTSAATNASSGGSGGSGGTGGSGGSSGSTTAAGGSGTSTTGSTNSPNLGGCSMFPSDNPWNTDISSFPLHPNSDAFIDSIGRDDTLHPDFGTEWEGSPIGIPYTTVDSDQELVPVEFDYDDESDPGPYPIPPDAPIEGGPDADGDRHVLVVETDNCILYELFAAYPIDDGASWEAGSGAIFDLASNELRPDRWTSADAAGLPVLPGLVRYDEVVEAGEIAHALRFTVSDSQAGYISPATHAASSSSDPDLPPMGLRLRMKAGYDCSGYSDEVQVICTALKRYGMIVADNGSNWYVSGAHDPRWSDDNLGDLKDVPGDAFEVVDTGEITPW
ncbi:MAG TPA: hypothetical protein VI197_28695 [Polyangiaceae bacterium]